MINKYVVCLTIEFTFPKQTALVSLSGFICKSHCVCQWISEHLENTLRLFVGVFFCLFFWQEMTSIHLPPKLAQLPPVAAPSTYKNPEKEELFDFFFFFLLFLLETFLFHFGKTEIIHASCSDVPFILFSTLQNKQMVSKMLKNKVAYVMFRTKLYTMKLYMFVDTVYI